MDKSAAILIVDDYQLIRTAVRRVLADIGFANVFQADNGKAAQELMRQQPIDVVIGDWGMPMMSGLDLLRWMRRDARHTRTPFMMLTAEANPASVRSALQAGVDAYMIKPFTVHSFASKFMAMIGAVPDISPVASAPEPAPAPAPAVSSGAWNVEELERWVDANTAEPMEQVDEWRTYLFFLRQHAAADGSLPPQFDGLIQDVFGDLARD